VNGCNPDLRAIKQPHAERRIRRLAVEILGILMAVIVPLVPGVTKWLDSMSYRNRARGRAEIIRAEHGLRLLKQKKPERRTNG
jgi:hypothetical protein